MTRPFIVPASVPASRTHEYIEAQMKITGESGRLMLFAGDQKVEHLNADFQGNDISSEDGDPEHLFQIASQARVGAFATQLGLIDRYGRQYNTIPYIVKLNSKTNIVPKTAADPISTAWYSVEDVVRFRQHTGLHVYGVGYTVFLGSEYESVMLHEAAQAMLTAHYYGMVGMVWVYPRGKYVADEKAAAIITGAAGVAACLGADYVKVNAPQKDGALDIQGLKDAVRAAGTTKLICAGGEQVAEDVFLKSVYSQIHEAGTQGSATGRNIHQKSLNDAIALCDRLYGITVENKPLE